MKTISAPLVLLVWILIGSAQILFPEPAHSAVVRALLIGIDDYKAPHIVDLQGCGNDVELLRSVLINKFDALPENIHVLKDASATHQGIVQAIQNHLIGKAQPGDVVILHYSGHGSRMQDASGDEIDGYDETIVPHDSRTEGVFDISDDDINGLLRQLSQKTQHVTFIFDSCHSGSGARAGNMVRMIDPDTRTPPSPQSFALGSRGAGEGGSDIRPNGSEYVLISGCLATELSNEAIFDGTRHGALTWFLAKALWSAPGDSTYRSVMDEVAREVTARYATQHPQIEGPGTDLRFFGTDRINTRPYVLVEAVDGMRVTVGGGKVHGLGNGSVLDIYSPATVDFASSSAVAQIKITDARDFSAIGEIENGGAVVSGSKAVPVELVSSDSTASIHIRAESGGPLAPVVSAVARLRGLQLVDSERDARLIVAVESDHITVRYGDMELAAPPMPLSTPDYVEKIVRQVQKLAHWLSVRDLGNPAGNLRIGLKIYRKEDPAQASVPPEVTAGSRLILRVYNHDTVPLFVYMLDVSSDGSIAVQYPQAVGAQEQLPPDRFVEQEIDPFVPQGRSAVTDVFKIIATIQPIDPSLFEQAGFDAATRTSDELPPAASLQQSLRRALRDTRASRPVVVKSWTTTQQTVTIRTPGVRLSGFAAHFGEKKKAEDLPKSFGISRSLCAEGAGADTTGCYRWIEASKDGTVWEMILARTARGENEAVLSVGQAFDEAYLKQEQSPAAIRVEPLLEVEPPGVVNPYGIEKRDVTSDDAHDPVANKDDQWHIKQIRAVEAWKKVDGTLGVAEGLEASGVLIAHPDTGYREHPETWNEFNGKRPVDPARGYDYYDGDNDALDPLLQDQILDNPGHGTASGSVIVSPVGCQLANSEGCVVGIARGAQLVPLRVHRTVSQFNTGNLSRAIRDVAQGKVSGNPKLISIAMGGPPTLALWKAVREAEEGGILIVAAGGNYVRTVVWPARFRSTIAVAANNVRCRPWKDTSRGSAIDISAPGESVWRASFDEQHRYMNGMGKGTTFATGSTAGAAGLWLSMHRNNPELARLQQQGLVTQAFRQALKKSAWRPAVAGSDNPAGTHCEQAGWDTGNFGPGILDIHALLELPLDSQALQVEAKSEELSDLPLFSSLYGEGVDPERIRSDYRALFVQRRGESQPSLEAFETEIMYHYTMNAYVQQAIDGLAEGQRGDEPAGRIREALLKQDLSTRLRTALSPAN